MRDEECDQPKFGRSNHFHKMRGPRRNIFSFPVGPNGFLGIMAHQEPAFSSGSKSVSLWWSQSGWAWEPQSVFLQAQSLAGEADQKAGSGSSFAVPMSGIPNVNRQ